MSSPPLRGGRHGARGELRTSCEEEVTRDLSSPALTSTYAFHGRASPLLRRAVLLVGERVVPARLCSSASMNGLRLAAAAANRRGGRRRRAAAAPTPARHRLAAMLVGGTPRSRPMCLARGALCSTALRAPPAQARPDGSAQPCSLSQQSAAGRASPSRAPTVAPRARPARTPRRSARHRPCLHPRRRHVGRGGAAGRAAPAAARAAGAARRRSARMVAQPRAVERRRWRVLAHRRRRRRRSELRAR